MIESNNERRCCRLSFGFFALADGNNVLIYSLAMSSSVQLIFFHKQNRIQNSVENNTDDDECIIVFTHKVVDVRISLHKIQQVVEPVRDWLLVDFFF